MTSFVRVAVISVALCSLAVPAQGNAQTAGVPPNVVLIVTDDQAMGTMDAMPVTRALIRKQGVALTNGFIPTSTCCPSRSALLSGQYAETTGVYRNVGRHGGWRKFNSSGTESHTIAVALHDAGYRTALLGKYLNGFALADPGYVPPGWDVFRAIFDPAASPALAANAYYDYELVGTGETTTYAHEVTDYSTDVLAELAVDFINTTPSDQPLFLYFATTAPHEPFTPAPRDVGAWHTEDLSPAATQLTSDRPDFWPDTLVSYGGTQWKLRRQHEALMAVDDAIGNIVSALGSRAADTLFVVLSDNGLQFGEHGLTEKYTPYSGSTEVPMFVRWDGVVAPGSREGSPVTNADLTVTIADAAGVQLVEPDGVSIFASKRPRGVLLSAEADDVHPAYCGWRTNRYMYSVYDSGAGTELYDYRNDPFELTNVAGRPEYADQEQALRSQTVAACSPTPPGFDW
jgi:arylsulfatase A-like enzyme